MLTDDPQEEQEMSPALFLDTHYYKKVTSLPHLARLSGKSRVVSGRQFISSISMLQASHPLRGTRVAA